MQPPNDSDFPDIDEDEDEEEGTAILSSKGLQLPASRREAQPFLVLLAGDAAGRMVKIADETVIGRSPRATVQLRGEGVSRFHAKLYRRGSETFLEDLGSTNGTQVNGERIRGAVRLSDGDTIQIGAAFLLKFSLQDELERQFQQQLFEAALRDPLTGAHNRRALMERVASDLAHAARHGDPYAVVLLDLDHFKQVNDQHGHQIGRASCRERVFPVV